MRALQPRWHNTVLLSNFLHIAVCPVYIFETFKKVYSFAYAQEVVVVAMNIYRYVYIQNTLYLFNHATINEK